MIRSNSISFSADVKIELIIAGSRFEVGQLGPGFAFLRQSRDINATECVIELTVDGKVSTSHVRLTTPITRASRRFEFVPIS